MKQLRQLISSTLAMPQDIETMSFLKAAPSAQLVMYCEMDGYCSLMNYGNYHNIDITP